MKHSVKPWEAVLAVFIIAGSAYALTHTARATSPVVVRWLLSHQPAGVFAHATAVFGNVLSKESGGSMQLQVISPESSSGDVPNAEVFKELDSGEAQLATAYTVALGKEDEALLAVGLPFLFADYPSAQKALDSDAASQLLSTFMPPDARALAFTMSGGFRIIATKDKPVTKASDLKGLRIVTSSGPLGEAILAAMGAVPVSADLESGTAPFNPAAVDGVETTYSRLSQAVGAKSPFLKYLNETDHSMFLTAIVVSKSFYDSLSPASQEALRDAARAAADVERQDSIALNESTKSALERSGSVVTALSPQEEEKLRQETQPVYAQFSSVIPSELVNALRAAQ